MSIRDQNLQYAKREISMITIEGIMPNESRLLRCTKDSPEVVSEPDETTVNVSPDFVFFVDIRLKDRSYRFP